MENEIDASNLPITKFYSIKIDDDHILIIHIVEFKNAIHASVYENIPKLGSLSIAYPQGGKVNTMPIFSGKHELFATSTAQILANKGKITYASVYLENDSLVSLSHLQKLFEKFKE